MKSIENNIFNKMRRYGRGWVFSAVDLIDLGSREAIDTALYRLKEKNVIRKIIQGVYDYPEISQVVEKPLPANMNKVAQAIARKFGWTITPSGETALNILGISNQVPAKYVYISTGRTVSYDIGNRTLQFKKGKLKEGNLKLPETRLLVQAIYALGKNSLTDDTIYLLKQTIDPAKYHLILKDIQTVTGWVRDAIKKVCEDSG